MVFPYRLSRELCVLALALSGIPPLKFAYAQDRAVVAVDDSPTAEQLMSQAEDHAANNPTESARLASKVLVEFGRKLVHVPGQADRFIDGRTRAHAFLEAHHEVMTRYRAAQSGEADRLESLGLDASLVETRLFTPAGCRAAIRQAQRAVEQARFYTADRLLWAITNHPDLASADPQVLLTLRTLVAVGLGDAPSIARHIASVRSSEDPAMRALGSRLERVAQDSPTPKDTVINPLGVASFGVLPKDIVRLWSEPLENSLYSRLRSSIDEGGFGAGGLEGGLLSGRLLVSVPTIVGSTILVNEGYVLRAYDAYSHQPKWYQFMGAPNSPRTDAQAGDLQVVVVASGRVFALSGHALPTERSGGGRLLCLDLETGAKIWEFSSERLRDQPEFFGLFLYGVPTVVGDTVIVLGRKVTARTETVSSVLGIDRESGEMRFAVPAGAAPGIRIGGSRPFTTPSAAGGWVFVSTGAGTTLCLDAHDGRVRWIRRDPVPVRDAPLDMMPWELGGGCVTDRGLVTLSPAQDEVQLLDPVTGETLDSMPTGTGTAWGAPKYFLTDRTHALVYAVGDGLTAFHTEDLRTPRWRLDSAKILGADPTDTIFAASGRAGIRGRVQSGWLEDGRSALIVPFASKAVVISGEDGSRVMEIACEGPANVVASQGVVAAATSDFIEVFTDATRAQQILEDSVKARPGDPDAVIGLVEFALRARNGELLGHAARLAPATLTAIAGDSARRDRFVGLLILAAQSGLLGRDGSDALFAAIALAAASPQERAVALLAHGEWLRQTRRFSAATAAWRTLLLDPDASAALVESPTSDGIGILVESGANAALQRIVELQRTEPSAAPHDLPAPTGRSFEELALAARTVPGTTAAGHLWLAAAKVAASAADRQLAAGAVMASVDAARASGDRGCVATTLAESLALLDDLKLPVTRAHLLDQCVLGGFDLKLPVLGGLSAAKALLASPASESVQGAPRPVAGCVVRNDGGEGPSARLMRGVLAPIRTVAGAASVGLSAFLVADRSVTRLSPPDLEGVWTVPLLGEVRFVAPAGDTTYIVEQPDRETIDVAAIDTHGRTLWRIDDVASAVSGTPVTLSRSECVLIPGMSDLVAVRADGSIASFSVSDSARRWFAPRVFEQIECADGGETLLAVGGTRSDRDGQTLRLAAIDRGSGAVLAEIRIPNDEPVRWVRVIDSGSVAFGTTRGVGRWQVIGAAQGIRWIAMTPRTRATIGAEPIGDRIVVTDATGRSGVIDWATGAEVSGAFGSSSGNAGGDGTRKWVRMGGSVVTWTNNDIALYTVHGVPEGAVALHGTRRIESVLPASCAIVAIEQGDALEEPREFGVGRQRAKVLLHRFGWTDGARIMGAPMVVDLPDGRLDRSQLIDGWILLGGPQTTTAVPLP
ncbi:MAG: hypothetical protein EXS03_02990 [Phycisphaerales bacterium]|nr:hypothetical protein [Phycisphaerales bacterium]